MDETGRLKFLVSFANADLARMREGDLINLQDDFEKFFEIGSYSDDDAGSIRRHEDLNTPGWRHYNPPKTGKRYPMGKLQPLQNELKSLLAAALSEPYSKLHIGGKINVEYVFIPPGIISYTGDHRDLFLLKIHDLVEDRDEMAKIRHCEMCGKFFFRVRRQKFCSRTCTLQTNKKTWMDKQREKKEAKLKKQKGK